MASPEPPVAFKDQCSIIWDNVLYVYSPDAFQTLPLVENGTWSQEENGVSVTGAVCVKGGVDGNGNDPALYVVGGATNSSVSNYSGIQRYSITQKKWQTISPITAVTANRVNHGAVYLNASSAILIYGGSQDGGTGYSTETFLMLMYPPYRVQAYSSIAPAVINPFMLPWNNDMAVMVGGSPTNQQVFTFSPNPGWLSWGVNLPKVLPDPSIGSVALQELDDGSKILETYYFNESPNRVTRNVLADPGTVVAGYGQTIGDQAGGGATSRFFRRQTNFNTYPAYNNTDAPTEQRTDASLAIGENLVAIVGGDANSTVAVFNSSGNTWVNSQALFGDFQQPLTVSSSTTSVTPTPTSSPTRVTSAAATSSTAAAAAKSNDGQSNGLAILGGVLGGICGLAAILIIFLLWLRSVRKRKQAEAMSKKKQDGSYPNDKYGKGGLEKSSSTPLSEQAQPMGRSPVPSAVISEPDSVAIFGARGEKSTDNQNRTSVQSYGGSKLNPNHAANISSVGGFFKSNNKTPIQISRPMLPDLGDYQERPSIDLGKATPSTAPVLPPVGGASSQQREEQRKTDEGWAKYFSEDPADKPQPVKKVEPIRDSYAITSPASMTEEFPDPRQSGSRPSTSKGGGFWPGAGVPTPQRATKLPLRDSAGNVLNQLTVTMASPSLAAGHENPQTRNLSVAAPAQAKISRAESISTSHSSDDGYEDDDMDAYSDTRDSYQQNAWNPIGNTWSGPSQRPLRPPSVRIGASAFPPPTTTSEVTMESSVSGGSSIPVFPMPAATVKRNEPEPEVDQPVFYNKVVDQPPPPQASTNPFKNPYAHARKSSNTMQYNGGPAVQDYFGPRPDTASTRPDSGKIPDNTDMSWLNLGTPAHIHGGPHMGDSKDPA